MAHDLVNMYWAVRSSRVERKIGVEDMPDDPDNEEIMTWAVRHIEAQHRVMVKDSQLIRELRIAAESGA